MATKTTLVLLLGSSGTGSGTLQNRYCGGFLNPSNGLTVNAPVRDCTQPVSFPGFMMNSISQQHLAKKTRLSMAILSIQFEASFVTDATTDGNAATGTNGNAGLCLTWTQEPCATSRGG